MEMERLSELTVAWRVARKEVKGIADRLGFRPFRRTRLIRMGSEGEGFARLPAPVQARIRCAEILDYVLNDTNGLADDLAHLDEVLAELRATAPWAATKTHRQTRSIGRIRR